MASDDYAVKLTDPETYRLADMAGVHHDLRFTGAITAKLKRRAGDKGPNEIDDDMLELEAMQGSALTHYGRCFNGGKRTEFLIPNAWIADLPADLRDGHRKFLNLRNKHIAHSVNDWEINTPVARVRVDRKSGEVNVHQVTVNQSRVVMLASDSLDKLWCLAKTLADRVEKEMAVEKARLLEHARLIPAEELKRRIQEDPPDFPGQRDVGKARGR